MYGRIVSLPLFTGISSTDLLELQERTSLSIEPIEAGTKLLSEGERTQGLLWIVNGTIRRSNEWIEEIIDAPILVEPERVFGLNNSVHMTWHAVTQVEVIYVSKEHVMRHLLRNSLIRINYLNLLSSTLQRKSDMPCTPRSAEDKLRQFVKEIRHPLGSILTLHIKMTDLARSLDISRLLLSRTLNTLAERGEIEIKREKIIIYAKHFH